MTDEELETIVKDSEMGFTCHEDTIALVAEVRRLRGALQTVRPELERWGWGDMHYSMATKQEQSVVDALRVIDAALS